MKKTLRKGTVILLSGAITIAQFTSTFADEAVIATQYESTEQENAAQEAMGDQTQEPQAGDFNGSPGGPGGQMPDGQPPERPDRQMPDGQPPEMPDGAEPPQAPGGDFQPGQRPDNGGETGENGSV